MKKEESFMAVPQEVFESMPKEEQLRYLQTYIHKQGTTVQTQGPQTYIPALPVPANRGGYIPQHPNNNPAMKPY